MNLYKNESGVIELLLKDFTKIKTKKIIVNDLFKDKQGLVVLYKPSCKYCIKMIETWSYLSILFKDKFIIGAINSYNYKDNLNINYFLNIPLVYPSIIYINKKGVVSKYEGNINKNDLIIFICNKLEGNCV